LELNKLSIFNNRSAALSEIHTYKYNFMQITNQNIYIFILLLIHKLGVVNVESQYPEILKYIIDKERMKEQV